MDPSGNQVRLPGPLRRSWSASLIVTVLAASLTGAACGERTSVETQLRDMSSDAEADGAPASTTTPDSPW
ncbi:MAG: hypothetical protein M5U19_22995 [Microthrixaceae bacterium]|nr:hypothetical protein [Microthrixaceae bacterium]